MPKNKDRLFQYAVLLHPTEDEAKDGKSTEVVVDIKTVCCSDVTGATMMAAREIPEEHMKFRDRLEVAVRPF